MSRSNIASVYRVNNEDNNYALSKCLVSIQLIHSASKSTFSKHSVRSIQSIPNSEKKQVFQK